MTKPSRRLSQPQRALLDEIEATARGVLYITRGKRYERTILALEERGLVIRSEPDYSRLGIDGWSLTEEGIAVVR